MKKISESSLEFHHPEITAINNFLYIIVFFFYLWEFFSQKNLFCNLHFLLM